MEIKVELNIKEEDLDSFMVRYVSFLKANAVGSELTIVSRTLGISVMSAYRRIGAVVRLDSESDVARVFAVKLIETYG